jgi:hypothetical protein
MEKTNKEARCIYLQDFYQNIQKKITPEDMIPAEVAIDYKPSGKIEKQTIPLLLLAGICGTVAGYFLYLILHAVSFWIFLIFERMGSCLSILICPAGLIYIFSPIAIPIVTGYSISLAGSSSKCRSSSVGIIIGLITGLLASVIAFHFANDILASKGLKTIDSLLDNLKPEIDSIIPKIVSIAWEGIFEPHNYVWSGIIGLIGFFFSAAIAGTAADTPFCEKENVAMKEKMAQRFFIEDMPYLLLGLLEQNSNYLNKVSSIIKKEKDSWDEIERLELILWTVEDNSSNLFEVNAFYANIKKTNKGNKISMKSRRVYSEWVSKEEAKFFSRILKFEL